MGSHLSKVGPHVLRFNLWLWPPDRVDKVMLKLFFPLRISMKQKTTVFWAIPVVVIQPWRVESSLLLSPSLHRGGWLGKSGPLFLTVGCQQNRLEVLAEEGRKKNQVSKRLKSLFI